ncbi:GPW/gp25 family protein [Paenibacillus campi]|uniref:GPW/gp25 family protein n=1 Tax=Paenibacillus campi TaxID=3106031 RepID=UPI002AFF1A0E|nr:MULTISPECIES: GPW/gp25 family protein [unclassified Paenibacillus]
MSQRSFLGRGWSFPVQVDPATGRIGMSEYSEDIREAIRILIGTMPGERVMNPEFGCRIRQYQFETLDVTTMNLMAKSVREAIARWEPRVTEVEVATHQDDPEQGTVRIEVRYRERATNHVSNQVYPFYLYGG